MSCRRSARDHSGWSFDGKHRPNRAYESKQSGNNPRYCVGTMTCPRVFGPSQRTHQPMLVEERRYIPPPDWRCCWSKSAFASIPALADAALTTSIERATNVETIAFMVFDPDPARYSVLPVSRPIPFLARAPGDPSPPARATRRQEKHTMTGPHARSSSTRDFTQLAGSTKASFA